jgi:hypothetical protein
MIRPGDFSGGAAGDGRAIRHATRAWAEAKTACWRSVIFVSLNFRPSIRSDVGIAVRLTEHIARREIGLFGKRVDRAVYGRLVQRFNRRVRRIPFLEHGYDRGWHAHVLMEKPEEMASVRFVQIIKTAWSESPWSTGLHDRVADEGAASYLTKERSKGQLEVWTDTIILEACVVDTK